MMMKKIFFILGVVFTMMATNVSNVQAQELKESVEKQKKWYAGGSLALQADIENNYAIALVPEFGYNFSKNFAVGVSFLFGYDTNEVTILKMSPYARWSFFRNDKFSIFLDGIFSFAAGFREDYPTMSAASINLAPGLAFHITEKISIVTHIGSLGYATPLSGITDVRMSLPVMDYTMTLTGDSNESGGIGINTGVSLGIYWNF